MHFDFIGMSLISQNAPRHSGLKVEEILSPAICRGEMRRVVIFNKVVVSLNCRQGSLIFGRLLDLIVVFCLTSYALKSRTHEISIATDLHERK